MEGKISTDKKKLIPVLKSLSDEFKQIDKKIRDLSEKYIRRYLAYAIVKVYGDRIKALDAIEVPELDFEKITEDNSPKERKGFPNSFSISFELAAESMRKFGSALKKAQRRESGSRHYRRKLLKHVPKKKLRRWLYITRKLNMKSDIV